MSAEAAKPKCSFLPCVRTPAVLAILSNLISTDMYALSLFKKRERISYWNFLVTADKCEKMSVVVWEAAQKWYCQYSFTHFTQKFWATVQWNKYPRSVAKWIFIPLRRPQICPSYLSNICGASLPEAFRLSTSISGGYSNNSCSSARSLFSAALSCNPYFFCHDFKTARSSFV